MDTSKLIAGLIGPVLAAIGIAVLCNRSMFPRMAEAVAKDLGLIFVSGILSLAAGLAIVRTHNVWRGWSALVTLLGWLLILGGLVRMWMPQLASPIATHILALPAALPAAATVMLVLGAFLSFKAFT